MGFYFKKTEFNICLEHFQDMLEGCFASRMILILKKLHLK